MADFLVMLEARMQYSSPILQVGVSKAFSEIKFSIDKFEKRNGKYDW